VFATAQEKLSAYRANQNAINKRLTIAKKAVEFNNQGIVAIDSRNYQQAIANFNLAIRLNPSLAEAYQGLGIAYSELGDNKKAIQQYDLAIKLDPNLTESYFSRGLSNYKLGNKEQAVEDWQQAIKVNPDHAKTYLQRGAVFYELGNHQEAVKDLQKAAELFAQQGDTKNSQLAQNIITQIPANYQQNPDGNSNSELGECNNLPEEQCQPVVADPNDPYIKRRRRLRLPTIPNIPIPSTPNNVGSQTNKQEESPSDHANKPKTKPSKRRSRK
jgi:tetratricopeptide (TPR) repeat protein